jgi:phosphohistidine phosphatase
MPARQLLLLRHAKAVTAEAGLDDFVRPLAERGLKDAASIGRLLANHGLAPGLALVSPARRTRETWGLVASQFEEPPEAKFMEELYDFGDGETLLEAIRTQGGTAERLMLVTHNPATAALASALSGSGEPRLRRLMAEKYPTAGLAIISFDTGNWAETQAGSGTLDAFVRPRDLGE